MMTIMEKKNEILELSFQFALAIIEFSEQLEEQTKSVIAKKLLKSGTSIGVIIKQAQNIKDDLAYINKLKNAVKAANDTEYWLHLCVSSPRYSYDNTLITKLINLKKMLYSIITNMDNNKSINQINIKSYEK